VGEAGTDVAKRRSFQGQRSPEICLTRRCIAAFVVVALVASVTASNAWAQAFTFGSPVSAEYARVHPDRGARKAKRQQARHCRLERHQVYDARSQLIWRTIQVCG
jgi:hypothetical protein